MKKLLLLLIISLLSFGQSKISEKKIKTKTITICQVNGGLYNLQFNGTNVFDCNDEPRIENYKYDSRGNIIYSEVFRFGRKKEVTEFYYDNDNKLIKEKNLSDRTSINYKYDDKGNLIQLIEWDDSGRGSIIIAWFYEYDRYNNRTKWYDVKTYTYYSEKELKSADKNLRGTYIYDYNNNLIELIVPDPYGNKKMDDHIWHKYDYYGNVIEVTKQNHFYYDEIGHSIYSTTTNQYDKNDNRVLTIDEYYDSSGIKTEFKYNEQNHLIEELSFSKLIDEYSRNPHYILFEKITYEYDWWGD